MPSAVSDTNHAAEQIQRALVRQAGIAQRIDLAAEMTRCARDGAFTALRRRYPEADEQEIRLLFAEQQYGTVFAQRVRAALASQPDRHDLLS